MRCCNETRAHDTHHHVDTHHDVLGKELMIVAGKALRQNITRLAPKILPWSEQVSVRLFEACG